jgi:chromosome partitioning protein
MSQIISLINEKGGVGKSSSAISIAQILAISGYSILLIDLDPQMNTSKMFGKTDEGNEEDYEQLFCSKLNDKSEVKNYISATNYENISILCASRVLNTLIYKIYDESKDSNVELCFKYNLELLKDDYDYIIIDNSPFKSYLTTCAICASNKIITPICVDNFSYDGLMSLFH